MNYSQASPSIPGHLKQTRILLYKCFSVLRSSRSVVLFHIFLVLFVFGFVASTDSLIRNNSALKEEKKYEPVPLTSFTKCSSPDCLNLGIVLYTEEPSRELLPWIKFVIEKISTKLNLKMDSDIKFIYKGKDIDEMTEIIYSGQEIMNIIYFCDHFQFYSEPGFKLNCEKAEFGNEFTANIRGYLVSYNMTHYAPVYLRDPNNPLDIDRNAILLKMIIDEAIINFSRQNNPQISCDENNIDSNCSENKNEEEFSFDLKTMYYPKPGANFLEKFDSMTTWSSFFYLFMALLSFSQGVRMMASEKDLKIRRGLVPFGLSSYAYNISWILFWIIFDFFFALLVALVGYILNTVTFGEINISIISFSVFYTVLIAYKSLGLMITTLSNDFKSANRTTYTIIVLSLFLQLFFSQNVMTNIFFLENRPATITAMDFILSFLPSFAFSIIYNHIHWEAGFHLNFATFNFEEGKGYNFTTYFTHLMEKKSFIGTVSRNSDFYFHFWIVFLIFLYLAVIFIFDDKIESNSVAQIRRTTTRPRKTDTMNNNSKTPLLSAGDVPLFSFNNLSKQYRSNRVLALNDVSINLREGETTALLGENGAGKSTLISIITGVTGADSGTIEYRGGTFGKDKDDSLLISVCAQFDLLWPSLTVMKNMQIIGEFRGLPIDTLNAQIKEILTTFGLWEKRDIQVRMLSGGMRRRVSIGIALLGDAELLIFDEPTTGLDPVNRKIVWEFLRNLKSKGKTIMLTTHIMEEADVIADSVAIVNKGNLLINKTSAEIKGSFKTMNVIFSLKNSSDEFFENLLDYFRSLYDNNFSVKFRSDSLIKINVPSFHIDKLKELVHDFEGIKSNEKTQKFADFIESFEVASLDLEEAYILVNEQHRKDIKTV